MYSTVFSQHTVQCIVYRKNQCTLLCIVQQKMQYIEELVGKVVFLKEKASQSDYVLVQQDFQYSVQYSLQYNVNNIVYCSLQFSVQYFVQYCVQKECTSLKAEKVFLLRGLASHFDVVVQYDQVQCTVQCAVHNTVECKLFCT